MELGQSIRELFAVSISNALLTVHTKPRAILRICRKHFTAARRVVTKDPARSDVQT